MRKLFLAVAALGMLATSCTKDSSAPVAGAGDSLVSFEVSAPVIGTRADAYDIYGIGEAVENLHYAIYLTKGTEDAPEYTLLFTGCEEDAFAGSALENAGLEFKLVNDQTYTAIFWADDENAPYTFDAQSMTVTMDPSALKAQDENLDAFFGHHKFLVSGPKVERVTLQRPFSQLNIATADIADAAAAGVVVDAETTTAVKVSGLYTTLNLLTEQVDGAMTELTVYNAAPKAEGQIGGTYEMLSMNYLLVNGRKLVDVTFDVETKAGQKVNRLFQSVPVERNYRTNILGSLFVDNIGFEVTINPIFEDDVEYGVVNGQTYVKVDTAADFEAVVEDGDVDIVILTGDIDLSQTSRAVAATDDGVLTIAKDQTLTIDLNGFNLSGVDTTEKNFGLIQNDGTLVIENSGANVSTIQVSATVNSGWNRYSAVISNNPGATLTVGANIVIEHLGGTDMAYGIDQLTNGNIGDVNGTIAGATVKSAYRAVRQFLNSSSKENNLTIKAGSVVEGANKGIFFHDPSTQANNGKLVVEDGATIVNGAYLFVTEGSTAWPVEVSIATSAIEAEELTSKNVPEGYGIVPINGYYTVVKGYVVSSAEELQAALNCAASVDIFFLNDIEGDVTVLQKDGVNVVVDGNGNKYNGVITVNGNGRAAGAETLTFKNINFDAANATEEYTFISAPSKINDKYNYSHNVTIENCTFTGNYPAVEVGSASFTGTYNFVMKGCTATNMHSALQLQSCDNTALVDGVTAVGCKNGISFGNTAYPTLKNSTISAAEYGVRADGNASRGNLVIENTTIEANQGIVVRKTTTAGYSVNLGAGVEIKANDEYDVVFTKGSDDAAYVKPTVAYSYTSVANFNVFPLGVYVNNAAQLATWMDNTDIDSITLAAGEFGTIVMKSNKTIIGTENAKVDCVNLNGADNITLKNINFDAATAKLGYDNKGAAKQYANIITGDNVDKKNKGSHNVVIDGCTFEGTFAKGGAAIAFADYYRTSGFSGNITIKDCTFDTVGSYYDIYGHYTGNGTNGYGDFVIENNVFKSVRTQGIAVYLGRYASSTPVVVEGNSFVVDSLDNAVYVQDHSNYGVSVDALNNTFAN